MERSMRVLLFLYLHLACFEKCATTKSEASPRIELS